MFNVVDKEGLIVKETTASKIQTNSLHKDSMKVVLKAFQEFIKLKVLAIEWRAMGRLVCKHSYKEGFL